MKKCFFVLLFLTVIYGGKAYSSQYDMGGSYPCQPIDSSLLQGVFDTYCEATYRHWQSGRTDASALSTIERRRNNLWFAMHTIVWSIRQYGTDACNYDHSAVSAVHRRILDCARYEDQEKYANELRELRRKSGQAEMLTRLGHTPEHIRYDRWLASIDMTAVPRRIADALRAKRWNFKTAQEIYKTYVRVCQSWPSFCS